MFQSFRTRMAGGAIPEIAPQEAAQQLARATPPMVIDVRSAPEFAEDGHLAGAHLIPLPTLAQRLGEIPRDQPVLLICRSGGRSRAACELLVAAGYTNLHNVQGGMQRWKALGLPLG